MSLFQNRMMLPLWVLLLFALMMYCQLCLDQNPAPVLRNHYWASSQEAKTPLAISGMIFGFRRFVADLLWLDLVQYYGDSDNQRKDKFKKFYPLVQSVTALDPHFVYAYVSGGAILGWNLKRPVEAAALMEEGILNNPNTPLSRSLALYLAALSYQNAGELEKMTPLLEEIVLLPEHPVLLERMLGMLYEKQKKWDKVKIYWNWVKDNTKGDEVRAIAVEHLKRLEKLSLFKGK